MSADSLRRIGDVSGRWTGGGGGDIYGGMEARVADLEKRTGKIEEKIDKVLIDLAEIKGKLSGMPTTWQIVTLVFAIMAGSFAIIRFGLPG